MAQFEVSIAAGERVVHLQLAGELDLAAAPELSDSIRCVSAAHGPCEVIVDLREVTFMDSTGIRVLADAHRRLCAEGCRLVITDPPPLVQRILEVMGFDRLLDVRPDLAQSPRPTEGS